MMQSKCGLWPSGGAGATDGTSRCCRHLLRVLQNTAGMEIRKLSSRAVDTVQKIHVFISSTGTCLRVESKVQGGKIHHRTGTHDQGEQMGLSD